MSDREGECVGGCGLAPEPGDVYCAGCRSGLENARYGAERD